MSQNKIEIRFYRDRVQISIKLQIVRYRSTICNYATHEAGRGRAQGGQRIAEAAAGDDGSVEQVLIILSVPQRAHHVRRLVGLRGSRITCNHRICLRWVVRVVQVFCHAVSEKGRGRGPEGGSPGYRVGSGGTGGERNN